MNTIRLYNIANILKGGIFQNSAQLAYFVCLVIMFSATQSLAITIDDAVTIALQNNPELQKQQLNQKLAHEDQLEIKGNNFGKLDIVSSYSHYNMPRTLSPMTPATIGSNPGAVATTEDLFTTALTYKVKLFTGFANTHAIEASALQKELVDAALKLSREQLVYNVKTLYVNILSLMAQKNAQTAYVTSLQRLYDDVSRELQLGRVARIDQLKAAAELKNGRARHTQLVADISTLKGALANLLGIEPREVKQLGQLQDLELPPEEILPVENNFSDHMAGLQRLHSSQLAVQKDNELAEKTRGALYPQVSLSASYGFNFGPNDSDNINSGNWENEEVWQAGLNLEWNIFDFGSNRSKIQKARIIEKQSRHERTKIELALKHNIEEAVIKINTAISDYDSATAEVALTQETADIEQLRFDQGRTDINDLLYAQARNFMAQSRSINAIYNYQTARFYLDYLLEKGERQ